MKRKYGNNIVYAQGMRFHSKLERDRFFHLQSLEKEGKINNLRFQVPFKIEVNGHKICKYIADFVYDLEGCEIVEDAKGVVTTSFRLKQKLMKAIYGIDIKISKTSTQKLQD